MSTTTTTHTPLTLKDILGDLEVPELSPEESALAEAILRGDDTVEVPELLLEEILVETDPKFEVAKGLAQRIKDMPTGQRIKLAFKGGREARSILLRDSNRLVKRLVLQNPRISEDELVILARNKAEDREMIEMVAKNSDWTKSYQLRHALVCNPKTPMPTAIRFVATLQDREVRQLAKSKNVPSSVSSTAKRVLLQRSGTTGGGGGGGH